MNSMGVQATLTVLLLFIATVKAAEGEVQFWGEKFIMTCPNKGKWFDKGGQEIGKEPEKTYGLIYDGKTKGSYHCKYEEENQDPPAERKYHFYVKGKACAMCFELNATFLILVIIADVVGTALVMLVICKCTKKKSSAGLPHTSKAPARSGGRAPPVPSPDYEQLNINTRSQDPYSVVNRMG